METATRTSDAPPRPIGPGAGVTPHALKNGVELFLRRVTSSGPQVAMRYKQDGAWKGHTFQDWDRASREIAAGLVALGAAPGDRVCMLANSRPALFST